MFSIGDKVSYPMHGAGLIEKIEDRQILGETRSYYIIRIEHGNMQVMVPVSGCETVGLRPIVKKSVIKGVLSTLGSASEPMDHNWNRRNRDNLERLKSGDLNKVAAVIRDLARADQNKKLSTGEKKLLSSAKTILASEIAMVLNQTEDSVIRMIDEAI